MPDRRELKQLSEGGINPERFAIRSEEAGMLRTAIQKLPAQYRIVLVLRDMEGLTDEDVAEITGLRAGTVRVRLHRARLFVRKEMMKVWKPRAGCKIGVGLQGLPSPRNRSQRGVRPCLPNFRTISMSNWTTLCVRNWKGTSTDASRARCFWLISKQRLNNAGGCRPKAPLGKPWFGSGRNS